MFLSPYTGILVNLFIVIIRKTALLIIPGFQFFVSLEQALPYDVALQMPMEGSDTEDPLLYVSGTFSSDLHM